jgi:YD repeat-containing protein
LEAGLWLKYGYDRMGRPIRLDLKGRPNPIVSEVEYHVSGMVQTMKLGSRIRKVTAFDSATLRPIRTRTQHLIDNRGRAFRDWVETQWDAAGNLTTWEAWRDIERGRDSRTYTYDSAHRLIQATYTRGPRTTYEYAYDAMGRITSFPGKGSYSYEDALSPYALTGTQSDAMRYFYDVDGGMLDYGAQIQMGHDIWGKPMYVQENGREKIMRYDADEQIGSVYEREFRTTGPVIQERHYVEGWLEVRPEGPDGREKLFYNLRFGGEVVGQFSPGRRIASPPRAPKPNPWFFPRRKNLLGIAPGMPGPSTAENKLSKP